MESKSCMRGFFSQDGFREIPADGSTRSLERPGTRQPSQGCNRMSSRMTPAPACSRNRGTVNALRQKCAEKDPVERRPPGHATLSPAFFWFAPALGLVGSPPSAARRARRRGRLGFHKEVAAAISAELDVVASHDRDHRANGNLHMAFGANVVFTNQGQSFLPARGGVVVAQNLGGTLARSFSAAAVTVAESESGPNSSFWSSTNACITTCILHAYQAPCQKQAVFCPRVCGFCPSPSCGAGRTGLRSGARGHARFGAAGRGLRNGPASGRVLPALLASARSAAACYFLGRSWMVSAVGLASRNPARSGRTRGSCAGHTHCGPTRGRRCWCPG